MARTLLSTVYRLACTERIEYGAARCSAKWTIASGWISSITRDQPVVLGGQVQVHEPDLAARDLLPGPHPLADRPDRRERLHLKLVVDVPTAEVVQDGDVMTAVRQVQRSRPATEPVAAKNQNAHSNSRYVALVREAQRPGPLGGASQTMSNRVMASRCADSLPSNYPAMAGSTRPSPAMLSRCSQASTSGGASRAARCSNALSSAELSTSRPAPEYPRRKKAAGSFSTPAGSGA